LLASKATIIQPSVNRLELKVEGFMVHRWAERWMEGIQQNMAWIKEVSLFGAHFSAKKLEIKFCSQ